MRTGISKELRYCYYGRLLGQMLIIIDAALLRRAVKGKDEVEVVKKHEEWTAYHA
jgi:hypothetical protein